MEREVLAAINNELVSQKDKKIFDQMYSKLFLIEAYKLALNSPDPSTQNGAVLVKENEIIGSGWNTMPEGVQITEERLVRPYKYNFIEHAERNAIYDAARQGNSTIGSTLYCPWFACTDCARGIICAGVTRVIGHKTDFNTDYGNWTNTIKLAHEMLREAGVKLQWIEDKLNVPVIRFKEEIVYP